MGSLRKIIMLLAVGMTVFLVSCSQINEDEEEGEKLTVMTSFYTMYEFTKQIAQDKATVELLIPAHVSAHDWEPAPKDIQAIQEADLFIYNSEYFETWVNNIENSVDLASTTFIHASEGILLLEGEQTHSHDEHDHAHTYDPHVWLSPILAQKQVENIADALIAHDPDNETFYIEHRDNYLEELQQLDELFRETLEQVEKREFITEHAAFGYLANEYDLIEIPIVGISPSLEPSAAQLRDLKQFAEEREITTIFHETLTQARTAETLANELGVDVEVLSTLEGLTKEEQEAELSYIDVMKRNLKALEKALN